MVQIVTAPIRISLNGLILIMPILMGPTLKPMQEQLRIVRNVMDRTYAADRVGYPVLPAMLRGVYHKLSMLPPKS